MTAWVAILLTYKADVKVKSIVKGVFVMMNMSFTSGRHTNHKYVHGE